MYAWHGAEKIVRYGLLRTEMAASKPTSNAVVTDAAALRITLGDVFP